MVNGTRVSELQRYINQLHLARKRCERRIEALGGQRHWVRAMPHLGPQTKKNCVCPGLTSSFGCRVGWTGADGCQGQQGRRAAAPGRHVHAKGAAARLSLLGPSAPSIPSVRSRIVVDRLATLVDLSIQHGHVLLHGVYGAQQGPRQAPVPHARKQVRCAGRGISPWPPVAKQHPCAMRSAGTASASRWCPATRSTAPRCAPTPPTFTGSTLRRRRRSAWR